MARARNRIATLEPTRAADTPATAHLAPGRRTRTAALAAPVQRRASSARGAAEEASAPRAAAGPASARPDWTDVVFRPDLHAAPVQRAPGPSSREPSRDAGPVTSPGAGQPLPDAVRGRMESSMGADFSAVRVHEGARASQLGAVAFTQGADIHFAPGRYDPGSGVGAELLGHELAHVVQQSEGRVAATGQAKPAGGGAVALNDDPGLEREADEMGARAARGEPARASGAMNRAIGGSAHAAAGAAIQRYRDYKGAEGTPTTDGGKLQRNGGYHIKFHPRGDQFQGQVFDEFHVTFELFDDDKLCPKIYFDDSGNRLADFDDTRANNRYKSDYAGEEGNPEFDDLIDTATGYANEFLTSVSGYLSEEQALELVEQRREEETQREERKQEEDERLSVERQERDKTHLSSVGNYSNERYTSLFGRQSRSSDKDEILKDAGLDSHQDRLYIKNGLWDKPKEMWENAGLGAEYERLQEARAKHELNSSPLELVEESTTNVETVTNEDVVTTTTTNESQLEDAKREVEDLQIPKQELTVARDKLKGRDNNESTDTRSLSGLGLPGPVIALIVAIGLMMFWQLLRVLGVM